MDPQEEINAGTDAAQVLDSRGYQAARKAVMDGIHSKMRTVPISDQNMHTRLIIMLQCMESIDGYLQQSKQSGEMALFQINEERKKHKLFGIG